MIKSFIAAAALVAVSALPAMAGTGSASATLNINASVVNACSVSVGDISMSAYDVFSGTGSSGSSTASVTCTKGASPSLSFASSVDLNNGTDKLTVGLTQSGSLGVSGSMHTAQTVTMNANAAAGQDVSAGAYSGSTTLTVNF